MQIVYKPVSAIKTYGANPRVNDNAVYAVANSIKEFGFKNPIIVDSNGVIVAGHTRYKAARKLNLKEVPCIIADDLTDEQIKAYRIADNSTGELAIWDDELLKLELEGLSFDFTDFGLFFDGDEDIKQKTEKESGISKMELRAFEHYDYLVFVFDNQHDFINAAQEFGIKRVDAGYSNRKIGIGRVLKGAELVKRITGNGNKDTDNFTESLGDDNDA